MTKQERNKIYRQALENISQEIFMCNALKRFNNNNLSGLDEFFDCMPKGWVLFYTLFDTISYKWFDDKEVKFYSSNDKNRLSLRETILCFCVAMTE